MNFKFRIENGSKKGIAYSNNKIPMGLFNLLNLACHEAINKFNGKLEWIDTFVKFEKDGKKYEQIKSDKLCEGCTFNKEKCIHPYFDTKPHCTGKIYIEN